MAQTVDTLIFELKVKDNASKVFDSWDKKLRDLEKQFERFGDTVSKSISGALSDMPDMDISGKVSNGLKGIGSSLTKYLINPFMGALDTIVGLAGQAFTKIAGFTKDVFVDAVTDSISLEDAMAGVRKTAGLTADEVSTLTRDVRDFAVDALGGMVSAEDLASALEIAGQQGVFAGKSFEQGSKDALAFAKTMVIAGDVFGGLTVEKAAEGLGLLHGRFSDVIPDVERAASVVNYFGDNTKRSEGFILNLAGRMAEVSATMGLTEASTIAVAATLGNLNQAGEKSGTSMNRIFSLMRFESTKFATAFGIDAAKFKQLAATDMEGALVVLAERLQTLGQSREGIDIVGQALSDLRLTGDGVKTTVLGLGANYDALVQNLASGKEQWDLNTSAMDSFIDGSDRTSKLWEALGTIWTNTIGVLSDMMLPVFKALLKDINSIAAEFRTWLVNSEFVTTTLPAGLLVIQKNLQEIIKGALEAIEAFDWSGAWEKTQTAFDGMIQGAKSLWESIKEISFDDVVSGINSVVSTFAAIGSAVEPVIKTVMWLVDIIGDVGTAVGTIAEKIGLVTAIESAFKGWLGILEGVYDILTGNIVQGFERIKEAIDTNIIEQFENIRRVAGEAFEAIKPIIMSVFEWAAGYISGKMSEIGNSIRDALSFQGGVTSETNPELFEPITVSAKDTARAIDDITAATKAANDASLVLEDTTVGNSVYPDMVDWVGKTSGAIQGMSSMTKAAESTQAAFGAKAVTSLNQMATAYDHLQQNISRYSPPTTIANAQTSGGNYAENIGGSSSSNSSSSSSGGASNVQGLGQPTSTVINISGVASVDESSKERLARMIDQVQRGLSSRAVVTA